MADYGIWRLGVRIPRGAQQTPAQRPCHRSLAAAGPPDRDQTATTSAGTTRATATTCDRSADLACLPSDRGHDLANDGNVPPTTIAKVTVPKLVGMKLADAKDTLADRELKATIRYKATARYRAGTVISQSRQAGASVLPDSTITLVAAKAPPPPPSTAPPPPTTMPSRNCDPSYPDVCLDPGAVDYDCAGGSGDGPKYVEGPIRVLAPDPFDLDRDGDGWGCED